MSDAVDVWSDFVERGCADSAILSDCAKKLITEDLGREALPEMAYMAFSLAAQSLVLGVQEVGKLSATIERCLALLYEGQVDPGQALPLLASAMDTIARAFTELAGADQSGARIESTPVEGAIYELSTLFPVPGKEPPTIKGGPDVNLGRLKRPSSAPGVPEPKSVLEPEASSSVRSAAATSIWNPDVDEDMLDLFFEEVSDRMEALSAKLLEMESRPADEDLLRDVFRDWHTIKGSSAMVDLQAMAQIAHAAEDLVGQLRDGSRKASSPVIDSLLGALDVIKDVASQAQARAPIDVNTADIFERLRHPEASAVALTPPPAAPAEGASPSKAVRQTIRVEFDKLDGLMNLVGELVLGRDGLGHAIAGLSALTEELSGGNHLSRKLGRLAADLDAVARRQISLVGDELNRVERVLVDILQELGISSGRLDTISNDLRESVMKLRMIPVGGTLRKHQRTVRDLANNLGKKVQLELHGEDTELDKLLVEALDEPLMHLVRNAVDHGIERPATRQAAGKDPMGLVQLSATRKGNQVVIELKDDGKGLDPEALKARARERELISDDALDAMSDTEAMELIFFPGFSTANQISEVSGRGVGMDVVRQTIVSRLKGSIDIHSELGEGSLFTLRLPLTLAIAQVLLARAGGEILAIPLDHVTRTLVLPASEVQLVRDREVVTLAGKQVPLIRINRVLELDTAHDALARELKVVLCEHGEGEYGLVVEGLLEKREIVIKSLGDMLEEVPCVGGATLIGDRCAVILDVGALIRRAIQGVGMSASTEIQPEEIIDEHTPPPPDALSVLLVEDSDIVRETLRRLLHQAGYRVVLARDGIEGLEAAQREVFDLISTDVMMPRMDGYEFTRRLRETAEYIDVPIIMVTSRGERIDRVRGFDAGVDEYITKPHDRHLLLRTVNKLLEDKLSGGFGGKPGGSH